MIGTSSPPNGLKMMVLEQNVSAGHDWYIINGTDGHKARNLFIW